MCQAVGWGQRKWWLSCLLQALHGWNMPESVHLSACSWLPAALTCRPLVGGVMVGGRDPEWDMHSPPDHKQIQSEEAAAQGAPGGTRPQVPE